MSRHPVPRTPVTVVLHAPDPRAGVAPLSDDELWLQLSVKEVVQTEPLASAEVERLHQLHAGGGSVYLAQPSVLDDHRPVWVVLRIAADHYVARHRLVPDVQVAGVWQDPAAAERHLERWVAQGRATGDRYSALTSRLYAVGQSAGTPAGRAPEAGPAEAGPAGAGPAGIRDVGPARGRGHRP